MKKIGLWLNEWNAAGLFSEMDGVLTAELRSTLGFFVDKVLI